jgi:RNA polymerase sigma-70 factor, ECF subfamily
MYNQGLMGDITLYLHQVAQGDRGAESALLQAIYSELHRLASAVMRSERVDHTLQPSALVNEAYLRLIGGKPVSWQGRAHFLNAASQTMRRILIDHARASRSAKRAGSQARVEFEEGMAISYGNPDLLLDIDQALQTLAEVDPRKEQIVQLRYFGGLSVEETAAVLDISEKTVKREWAMARAWLESKLRPL